MSSMSAKEFGVYKYLSVAHDPENLTLGNLFSEFLFHRDISHTTLLNHNLSEEEQNKCIHNFFLFLSILIQILLKQLEQPLKKFRCIIEHFLNGNETPGSANFFSFLGHFDMRLDLDKKIKHEDGRYNAALCMMSSKIAYENEAVIQTVVSQHWKMEFVKFYNFYNEFQKKWTTQAFIFREETVENDTIYVCFRGTSLFNTDDWSSDFDFSWCKIKGMGKVHMGFSLALGLKKYKHDNGCECECELQDYFGYWPKQIEQDEQYLLAYYTIREKLKAMMQNNKRAKFIVTGHSLGGALAVMFPAILALHSEWELLDRLEVIYTFGQPRVGDEEFGEFMIRNLNEHRIKYYRIVYANDIVPTVPFHNCMMFNHFGTCIHFNSLYHGEVVQGEEKIVGKTMEDAHVVKYLWLLIKWLIMAIVRAILSRLNAVWEFIRGFIIGCFVGQDYKEGWIMILGRVSGILLPGFIEHFPQDYVNATWLCSKDLFQNQPLFSVS